MYQLKPLPKDVIPAALEKARCYRFINEPMEAESICLDILEVDKNNQSALITLILSITDQFDRELSTAFTRAKELLSRLDAKFHQVYYEGIICERRAKTHLKRGGHGSGRMAYEWFQKAMSLFDQAIDMSPAGDEEAVLRWNACARQIMRNPGLKPGEKSPESMLE